MNEIINIGIIDDEGLFVEALSILLETNPKYKVMLCDVDAGRFLDKLTQSEVKPDVILLDLNMQPMNGLMLLDEFHRLELDIKIIVLSSLYNSSMYGYMIKYGISGFLPKYSDKQELFQAIDQTYYHNYYINESSQSLLNEYLNQSKRNSNPWSKINLTEREIEILKLICQEYSTKDIAEMLFISVKTVESHRAKLMEKIGCKNVIGMVIYAIINGIYVLTNVSVNA